MRRTPITIALLCAAMLAACLGLPAGASASSHQVTIMQDDGLLLRSGDSTRSATLDEFQKLGVDVVKVQVYWNEIAPKGGKEPAGFDATNPAGYNWHDYDGVVRGAVARGMQPYLVLGNRAPAWASKSGGKHNGTYRPSAKELALFAQAAGTRYSGSYAGLPRVSIWSIWNEPNLSSWLGPQRTKGGTPLSPSIYRNLYLAGHKGLVASGHDGDKILLGELAPRGRGSDKVPPLTFLREVACLDSHYRAYRGKAAKARGCPSKLGRIPTSGIAYHPYTPSQGGPHAKIRSDEASIATLSRIARVSDRIAGHGRLSKRARIWVSEFGFQTDPPDPFQNPIKKVPGYMDESEWLAFRNSRVASYSQYTLHDDALNPGSKFSLNRYAGFQMGLRFSNGKAKPGVYSAFRLPAFVRLLSGNRVEVFGGLRTSPGATATVSSAGPGGKYTVLAQPKLNSAGYFRFIRKVSAASKRKYKISIGGFSRTKRPARR
jgi:hypothetical protein